MDVALQGRTQVQDRIWIIEGFRVRVHRPWSFTHHHCNYVFALHAFNLYYFLCNNSLKHLHFSYINILSKETFIITNKKKNLT